MLSDILSSISCEIQQVNTAHPLGKMLSDIHASTRAPPPPSVNEANTQTTPRRKFRWSLFSC